MSEEAALQLSNTSADLKQSPSGSIKTSRQVIMSLKFVCVLRFL